MHFIYPAFLITFTAPLPLNLSSCLGVDMPFHIDWLILLPLPQSVWFWIHLGKLHPVELTFGLTDLMSLQSNTYRWAHVLILLLLVLKLQSFMRVLLVVRIPRHAVTLCSSVIIVWYWRILILHIRSVCLPNDSLLQAEFYLCRHMLPSRGPWMHNFQSFYSERSCKHRVLLFTSVTLYKLLILTSVNSPVKKLLEQVFFKSLTASRSTE